MVLRRPHSLAAQEFNAPSRGDAASSFPSSRWRCAYAPARLGGGEAAPLSRRTGRQHDFRVILRQKLNPLRRGTIESAAVGNDHADGVRAKCQINGPNPRRRVPRRDEERSLKQPTIRRTPPDKGARIGMASLADPHHPGAGRVVVERLPRKVNQDAERRRPEMGRCTVRGYGRVAGGGIFNAEPFVQAPRR